jgi:Zn-dependent protease
MRTQIRVGRVLGTEIGLHFSWFVIATLIVLSLASRFRLLNPSWSTATVWMTAVVAGLFFFASLLVHELSHAAVARSRGIPVRGITLFAFGGLAQIEKESSDAKTEFWMGIVGPITSALIGGVCLALAALLGWTADTAEPAQPALAALKWLGFINLGLAAFNLLPGFPLDGGRVLRAVLWWKRGDHAWATQVASAVGQAMAMGLVLLGLLQFFAGGGGPGLWLVFLGWFLFTAAQASQARVAATEALRGVKVADVMTRDCPRVDGRQTLRRFVEESLLRTGRRCFFVQDDGRLTGLITPLEVKEVDPRRQDEVTVAEVMRPLDRIHALPPDAPASEALEAMAREDVNQVPVMRDGRLEGVISRGHLIQLLQTRAELRTI